MAKTPTLLRQFLAEVLGTFFLVLIGDASIAQYQLSGSQPFLAVALGYGLALMIGILISGGVSGGHLNPAVTLSMACLGKCRWVCVPVYWAAQYLGAFIAAAVVFGVYYDGIGYAGGVIPKFAGIFATYPGNDEIYTGTLICDQVLGTAVLLLIILAVTDDKNMKVPSGLVPLLIGLGLSAIHLSLAYNAGCAINPARDFSPRLLTLIAGFGTEAIDGEYNFFFWIPLVMPHIGGLIGAAVYYVFISMHHRKEVEVEPVAHEAQGNVPEEYQGRRDVSNVEKAFERYE